MHWLVGLMGVGKTTAGMSAAVELGVEFHDTDSMVIEEAGMSIAAIWQLEGEHGFRRRENAAVQSIPTRSGVAAAGGGAPMDPANAAIITAGESVVWLRCDPHLLAERVGADGTRPLLGTDALATLTRLSVEREPIYQSLATATVETGGKTPDQVADELVRLWNA